MALNFRAAFPKLAGAVKAKIPARIGGTKPSKKAPVGGGGVENGGMIPQGGMPERKPPGWHKAERLASEQAAESNAVADAIAPGVTGKESPATTMEHLATGNLAPADALAHRQPLAQAPNANTAFAEIATRVGADSTNAENATYGGHAAPVETNNASTGDTTPSTEASVVPTPSVTETSIPAPQVTERGGDASPSASESQPDATEPIIVPITTDQANRQQIANVRAEGEYGIATDEATAQAVLDHAKMLQEQAQQRATEQAADPMAATNERIQRDYVEPATQRKVAEQQAIDAATQRYTDLATARDRLNQTNWEQEAPSKIPNFATMTPEQQRTAIEEVKTKALKANAEAEIAFVKSELKTREGQARVEAAIKKGDKNIEEAKQIAMLELAAEQAQAEGAQPTDGAGQQPAGSEGQTQNAGEAQDEGPEKPGTARRKEAQAALDEYNRQLAEVEAEKQKAIDDKNEAGLANAENKLARIRKQMKDSDVALKVMPDDEVVALIDKQMDETYQDEDGRVHQRLPDRFATEGRIHFIKNGDRKEAMKQVASMQQELAKIKADDLSEGNREILEAAKRNGSTRAEDHYEKNMGYMLSRVEDLKRPWYGRYGWFKTKLTPEQQQEVALDQLRLLTGQMSEKELKNLNRPSFKKILLMIAGLLALAIAQQVIDTTKESTQMSMQQ